MSDQTNERYGELNREALTELGKPYGQCTATEQEAVEFGVASKKLQEEMLERGVENIGELVEARRREQGGGDS